MAGRSRRGEPKPFDISKWAVWEAYRRVRANQGAAGVDEQSIEEFERDLKGNLYKLWNRLSSGSYHPPPVRAVEIAKKYGGSRMLGVPTVAGRIAQTVVRMHLEPGVEPVFHPDSYGYRPGRSPLQAVGVCRQRCWKADWVVDLDIKAFFDSIDHELLLRAVALHTDQRWVLAYVTRWLQAPLQLEDGSLVARDRGSPQGSAISPLLANIFLHYAFDAWMARTYPGIGFERYCDDVIVHCHTQQQASEIRDAIAARLVECGLELNQAKTRVVYCKDDDRRGSYEHHRFDFLGYTFRPRLSKSRFGKHFVNFSAAVADEASKRMRQEIRSWRLHRRSDKTLTDLARMFNAVIRGWINYYGRFYKSALYPTFRHLNEILVRWAVGKFKRLRRHRARARRFLQDIAPARAEPVRPLATGGATVRLDAGSRMSREVHVRFCEGRGVRFPPATHLRLEDVDVAEDGIERRDVHSPATVRVEVIGDATNQPNHNLFVPSIGAWDHARGSPHELPPPIGGS